MKYEITFEKPLSHLLNIKLTIDQVSQKELVVYLPFWRPGRYEAANYSKNIRSVTFEDEKGNSLNWEKRDANQWVISTAGSKKIIVSYQYFAFTLDAGNSWYDDNLIYINFINCLFFVSEKINNPCELTIDLPKSYRVASALRQDGTYQFLADSYYELADSPLLASADLEQITYKVADVDFHIWINGEHSLDTEQLKNHFKAFSDSQISAFGNFPEKEYHFLLLLPPYKHYHGVEHAASTVIVIGPGNELSKKELYKELLGVSSHELFHAWNIIKIRPKALMPYDFTKPITFSTGYVAEGFTTYYGDLFLSRSGVFDKKAYLKELSTLLNRHFWNYGRYNESVITSSMNLWVDGYTAGAPNKKSSIYVEGAMVALMLDLKIRAATNSKKSLDDVMRLLWTNYGEKKQGYSHTDIIRSCEKVLGEKLDDFFSKYVEGTTDKFQPINDLLATVGCTIEKSNNENLFAKYLGIRMLPEGDDLLKVVQIAPGSVGERYFSINDKIKESDKSKFEHIDGKISLNVIRNHKELTLNIELGQETYFNNNFIVPKKDASNTQMEAFEGWTGHAF